MRVGILTFHAQLNYGGVLQAFALQTALERMGHEVVMVDRWLSAGNVALRGPFAGMPVRSWVRWLERGVMGCGTFGLAVRHWRTMRFVRKRLRLTPYHFVAWEEMAGRALGVDCLVVGSDQVWHGGDWGDPLPYLLEGAPPVRAVAYAASFGMRRLPEAFFEAYRKGFPRFSAIGVRESEGVGLVASAGGRATHVVDPTQLVDAASWRKALALRGADARPRLVCYFLSENVLAALPALETFARERRCAVEVFVDRLQLPMPKSPSAIGKRLGWWARRMTSPVRLRLAAGPREFVGAFSSATWVLSDSFHALMFASIFGVDVRILRPKDAFRQMMFGRIEEFVKCAVKGTALSANVQEALASFAQGEPCVYDEAFLRERREASRTWLAEALSD